MPLLHVNSAELYYEEQGSGSETIIFAHGLLWSCRMYDDQVAALKDRYRCITFDFRGQGQSEVTRDGYDMETLYADTVALIETLNCAPCHFVGLSMGGFIALRLAARRPELLRSLILLETTADPEPSEHVLQYKMMSFIARWLGPGVVAKRVMPIMFGQKFLNDPQRTELQKEWRQHLSSNHRIGSSRATIGIVKRAGVRDEIGQIHVPTLVIVGDQDIATPPVNAQQLHAGIVGSQLVIIPGAGHTSTVEEPTAVNAAISEFLARVGRR